MSKSQPKNDANVRPVGNPLWYKGMPVSPHPAGRPKGLSTTTKLMQRMMEDADGVVDAIVAKALEGDTGAASLIISRAEGRSQQTLASKSLMQSARSRKSGQLKS